MNVDFTLPANPGIARRLLYLAEVYNLELDPDISNLAKKDILPEIDEIIPSKAVAKAAKQFIHDCNFRCGIPSFSFCLDRNLIVEALALGDVQQVTIISPTPNEWKNKFNSYKCFTDVKIVLPRASLLPENQDGRRDGVLIYDWNSTQWTISKAVAREFAKTILFWDTGAPENSYNNLTSNNVIWHQMASCLYPNMPLANNEVAMIYNIFLPEYAVKPGYNNLNN